MNPTIFDAIESDNLELFRLLYKEHIMEKDITSEIKRFYMFKVGIYLQILGCIKNIHNKDNYYERYEPIKDVPDHEKIIVTKESIYDLSKILKSCLVNNSKQIFQHIINNIIPEYTHFCHRKFNYDFYLEDLELYVSKINESKLGLSNNLTSSFDILCKIFKKQRLYYKNSYIKDCLRRILNMMQLTQITFGFLTSTEDKILSLCTIKFYKHEFDLNFNVDYLIYLLDKISPND